MKKLTLLTIFVIIKISGVASATESSTFFGTSGAYYFDDNKGYEVDNGNLAPISYSPISDPNTYPQSEADQGRDLGTGWGSAEIKATLTHSIKVPFMTGEEILNSDNNILFRFKGEVSPVSINTGVSATLTPIAFLNFQAGTSIGTGWNFFGIFNGLGLNNNGTGIPEEDPLPGVVSKSWISGTFQFDLGAVIPGEWTHVIMAVTAKTEYKYFSGANSKEAWQYEADAGENFNGYSFMGNYILGYQLPYKLDTVAFLVETEQMIGTNKDISSNDPVDWGSDFVQVTFGPLVNIKLSDNSNLLILVQFRTEKLFSEETIYENYFRNREYIGSYIDFRRIAFSYSRKIK